MQLAQDSVRSGKTILELEKVEIATPGGARTLLKDVNLYLSKGDRIGIVGHSFGGKWSLFASCLYEKFACAAWSDAGIVFDERDRRKENPGGSPNRGNSDPNKPKSLSNTRLWAL